MTLRLRFEPFHRSAVFAATALTLAAFAAVHGYAYYQSKAVDVAAAPFADPILTEPPRPVAVPQDVFPSNEIPMVAITPEGGVSYTSASPDDANWAELFSSSEFAPTSASQKNQRLAPAITNDMLQKLMERVEAARTAAVSNQQSLSDLKRKVESLSAEIERDSRVPTSTGSTMQ